MKQPSAGLDKAMAALLLGVWVWLALMIQHDIWAPDLSAVYIAGWLWAEGAVDLIYAAPGGFMGGAVADWVPDLPGVGDRTTFPYLYPPLWAALVAPLASRMPPGDFFNAVALVQVPLLAASVVLAGRLAKPPSMRWSVWSLWGVALLSLTTPAIHLFWQNQPSILVGFLTLLAMERLVAGRGAQAGTVLALAAAIKLTPAAFVLVFLTERNTRALAAFALAGLALALLSVAVAGWPLHGAFLTSLSAVSEVVALSGSNVSLKAAFLDVSAWLRGVEPGAIWVSAPPALSAGVTAAAAGLVLLLGRWLAPLPAAPRRALAVLALGVILPLFGPLGWQYYYLPPLLMLPALRLILPARVFWPLSVAVLALSLFPLFVVLQGAIPGFARLLVVALSAVWLAVLVALGLGARKAGRTA